MDDPDSFNESEEEVQSNFNINDLEEKEIWRKEIINNYTYPLINCSSSLHDSFRKYERKKAYILSILFQSNRKPCKTRKNLRHFSFLSCIIVTCLTDFIYFLFIYSFIEIIG